MRQLISSSVLGLAIFAVSAGWAHAEKSCDRLVALIERHHPQAGMHPLPLNPDQAKALRRADDETACRDALPRIEAATQTQMRPPPSTTTATPVAGATVETVPVSRLKEKKVFDMRGREVGDVERVVLLGKESKLHAVIGIGGFLGIGERKVAIALEEFALHDERLMVRKMSEQELRNLPPWKSGQGEEITGDRTAQMTVVR